MPGIKVSIKGFDEAIKRLDIKVMQPEITAELDRFGKGVAQSAQNNVSENGSIDEGGLVNSIGSEMTDSLTVRIFANKDYAAFVEFGTRKFAAAHVATLPPDWQAFASQYKGRGGGSFQQLLVAITAWVKRKGIAALPTKSGGKSKSKSSQAAQDQAAYLIARSILINGMRAKPFLYPAFNDNTPLLMERLKKLFK